MKKNKTTHFMAGILILIFTILFLVIAGRFLYIQSTGEINGVSLEKYAKEKRTTSYTLESERGKIYDNNGMALAYDRPTFRLYAVIDKKYTLDPEEPMHVTDPEKTAEMLAPLLDADKQYILKQIKNGIKKDRDQVEFGTAGKELTKDTKDKIDDLHLPGIKFNKESVRYYPNGIFASRIIGFTGKKDGIISGTTGMEKELNKLLSGKDGSISYKRDKYGFKLLNPDQIIKKPVDGDDVYLTLDQKIQTSLEEVMTQVADEYKPKRMTAVVMNPKTGEILAMSNRPSYNPNNPSDVKNWYNDVISTPFEPGSTMKIFTWAAAIDAGVYKGDEWYKSGQYQISNKVRPIHDWKESWGSITYDDGFMRSSNVAAAKLVWEKLGPEKYLEYLKKFDFDQKTNIDLPGEVPGRILYNWPIEKITTAFGQGTTLTPIQQMKAATAIVNGGKMLQPYVISKIVNPNSHKVIQKKSPKVVGQAISKDTADRVKELMGKVVTDENGTGKIYKLDDYSVAGKTGTAQLPAPNGGYLTGEENYTFSFLGMAPKDDPELMMYVSIKQPDLDLEHYESGSVPISYVFKNVMKTGLHYMDIKPDKTKSDPVETISVPDVTNKDTKTITKSLSDNGFTNISVIGNGKTVKEMNVKKDDKLFPDDRILLVTDKPVMPDITGWSMRDVLQLADLLHVKAETIGNGFAIKQSIKKGSKVKKNAYLGVEFNLPNKSKEKKETKKKK